MPKSDDDDGIEVVEEVDGDGAPIRRLPASTTLTRAAGVAAKGSAGGAGVATVVGVQRNPSGQTTLAFDRKPKKRRRPQTEHHPEGKDKRPKVG